MLTLDGSHGEGGGQIIRTALALSLVTGTPFRAVEIRARRRKPGLRPQHLAAVRAAAKIANARVTGAEEGAREMSFAPGAVIPGSYEFAVGTAGSATLVLQTILPALLTAAGPSTLVFEGGTHNPLAPTFDFLREAFLPLVNRMGPRVSATLHRHGFYPAGGGRFTVELTPVARLAPLELVERGALREVRGRALVANLPVSIAERELAVVARELGWPPASLRHERVGDAQGPGNVLSLELQSEQVTEVFTGFGERGVRAEQVAAATVAEVRRYLAAGVPVGAHLADQLMPLLALASAGHLRTVAPSGHTRTQLETIGHFLGASLRLEQEAQDVWRIEAGGG